MTARPLSEVYAGVLSRNWPKLLEILASGEKRLVVHRHNPFNHDVSGIVESLGYAPVKVDVCSEIWQNSPMLEIPSWSMTFGASVHGHQFNTIGPWLDNECLGFFPASDDEK